MLKKVVSVRRIIQAVLAVLLYLAVAYLNINLLYVILFGSALGIVLGKVFCRWMCPIGLVMEVLMGLNQESRQRQLYSYYKLGCPIAWISGFLNRFSLFKVKRKASLCVNCGVCDKTCYIAALNPDYSLYKKNKANPSVHYSCSKCLECVKNCPTGSLGYTV